MKYSIFRLATGALAAYASVPVVQMVTGNPPGIATDFLGIPEPETTIRNNIPYAVVIGAILYFWALSIPASGDFNVDARE
jgi:hypothetical protein